MKKMKLIAFILSAFFILGKSANAAATNSNTAPILESTTQNFVNELKAGNGMPIYKLSPTEARTVLRGVQSTTHIKLKTNIEEREISIGSSNKLKIYIVRPKDNNELLPVIMYFHGGGWVLGDKDTHERLISEIACGVQAAVIFIDYDRSPEAKYPTAINQAYAATKWVVENSKSINVDSSKLAIAGDSVGGNMAIAVSMLAKKAQGPRINFQVLFYPVTNASFRTVSYEQFAEGPWLTREAMKWFWDSYLPDVKERSNPLVSPLQATVKELQDLPPALIITAENDVLRDEGEEYAKKLMQAGVEVTATRYIGTIHDFVMLNPIEDTLATRSAISQVISALKKVLK